VAGVAAVIAILAVVALAGCRGRDRQLARQASSDSVAVSDSAPSVSAGAEEPASAEPAGEWTAGTAFHARVASGVSTVRAMRSAAGADYDRFVIEFEQGLPGYHIEYVDRPVRSCASGHVIELPGDAWLSIRMQPAAGHSDAGRAVPLPNAAGQDARNFLKVAVACDFEADYTLVLAVRSPGKYRVLELANPDRLVVDVRWQ
jgi:hypothetical protein